MAATMAAILKRLRYIKQASDRDYVGFRHRSLVTIIAEPSERDGYRERQK